MLAIAVVLAWARAAVAHEPPPAAASPAPSQLQKIVDAMRAQLALSHDVSVELVEHNPLKASVEPINGPVRSFRLSIEQGFLEQLTPDELKAVVAHELGHVWIYTHFPYLQTEQLANQIALKVVTRDALDRVYGKVWPDSRSAGSLPRFPSQTAIAAAAEPVPVRPEP